MAQTQVTTATVPSGTTVVYTTAPGAPVVQQVYVMPNKRAHIVLGIIQMILGCGVLALSVIGIIIGSPVGLTGSGIYGGVFFFVAGFMGFRAAKQDSRNYLVTCIVMCIIATVISIIASSTAGVERGSLMGHSGSSAMFQATKCTVVIGACVIEFFVSIVHAGVACGSCCGCCPASQQPQPVPAATQVVIQQPSTAYQPMQQQTVPMPQPGPYPSPQPPQQPMMQPPYQQPMAQPPYHQPTPMPQPPGRPPYHQPMPMPQSPGQPPYHQPMPMPQSPGQPPYHQPMPMPQPPGRPPYQQPMPHPPGQQPYHQPMPMSQPPYQQSAGPAHPQLPPEYANPPPYSPEAVPTAPSAPPSAPTMEAGPLPPKA